MGKVVNLDDYRRSAELEEEYLQFISHINKLVKVPTDAKELARCFYFALHYLEDNINCFSILSMVKTMPDTQLEEMRQMVVSYLDSMINDLNKF